MGYLAGDDEVHGAPEIACSLKCLGVCNKTIVIKKKDHEKGVITASF